MYCGNQMLTKFCVEYYIPTKVYWFITHKVSLFNMMKTRDDFFKELGTWPILTAQYFDEFFPENNLSLCSCWLQKPMPRFAYHRVPGSFAAFRLIKPAFTEEQLPSVSVTSVVELEWAEISWNELESAGMIQ